MFYRKLTRTTIPKILSVSLFTTKEHPYKVKKKSARQFFHKLLNPYKTVVSHLKQGLLGASLATGVIMIIQFKSFFLVWVYITTGE